MGSTCAALDGSAPPEIQEALRVHINAEKAKGNPQFASRTLLDQDECCFTEDLGGDPCSKTSCAYAQPSPDGSKAKIVGYSSHKQLERPIPGLAVAAAKAGPRRKARPASRKRRPAPRKRPARRKAKAGRRRR
jgi:hypothetical protein